MTGRESWMLFDSIDGGQNNYCFFGVSSIVSLTHENNRVDTKNASLSRIQAELCKVYAVKNGGKHGSQDGGYKSCLL